MLTARSRRQLLAASILTVALVAGEVVSQAIPPSLSHHGLKELSDVERLALLRVGVRCRMASTYDRTGGNDDGFNGTYSRLRAEGNDSVLAEIDGPGRIQRFWMPYSRHEESYLLDGKNEHIRFYLDGEEVPRIDIPIHDLFNGTHPVFPKPLVGEGSGGFYCYVPITFVSGCKLMIDGDGARFWQLTYNEFETAAGLKTFSTKLDASRRQELEAAVELWNNVGNARAIGVDQQHTEHIELSLDAGESTAISLPEGAHVVRAIELTGDPQQLAQAGNARVSIYWDSGDRPSIDLPLSYLFGSSMRQTYDSLLMGAEADRWYCYLPMPYGESARIEINADQPFDATLSVNAKPLSEWRPGVWGYLHGLWRREFPTQPGRHYSWLNLEQARGHYIGTVLDTHGLGPHGQDNWNPVWLEGDETFRVNGELDMHGTGTEDYFNCGWYSVPGRLSEPGNYPLHGYSAFKLGPPTTYATSHRWHLTDPIPFDGSITAQIEVGWTNNVQANYQSATYFYLDKP